MYLVRSGAITGFERLVADFGVNPLTLMAAVGLSHAHLRDPNTYVSYSKVAELLELAAEACNESLFGLLLSERQTSTVLGELLVALSQHPTLQETLLGANKYLYLHARGARLNQTASGNDLLLHLLLEINSPRGVRQLIQMSVGQMTNFITELLDIADPTIPVLLRQDQPLATSTRLNPQMLTRLEFGSRIDGIRIPANWLNRKPHFDEATLQRHFQDYMQSLQQRYPDNLQDQVRDIIGQFLPTSECSIDRVAATLDLHPRVLQKRLQKLGTTYVKLLQATRREIAEQHLRHNTMTITDLAYNLGYADVSVFSRHFKGWTGLSPRQWQRQQG